MPQVNHLASAVCGLPAGVLEDEADGGINSIDIGDVHAIR